MFVHTRLQLLSLLATLGACVSPTPASAPLGESARESVPCPEARAALPAERPPPGGYDSGPGPKIGDGQSAVFVPPAHCIPTATEAGAR